MMVAPMISSAPQSWYGGCMLESQSQKSYDPNMTAVCPGPFSENSSWAVPNPTLAAPSLAPNSGASTTVASAAINGGPDGSPSAIAASPAQAAPGETMGPATFSSPVPSPLPPYWNSPPPPPPSFAEQAGNWACEHPAFAAVAIGLAFMVAKSWGKN